MLHKILVPTDFSEASKAALLYAEELALLTKAELVLLHICAAVPFPVPYAPDLAPTELYEELDAETSRMLENLASPLTRHGVQVRCHQVTGEPEAQILEVAERTHADMIVIGTHGRNGYRRMLLGSVAEHVVRAAKIPVLTVHAQLSASP